MSIPDWCVLNVEVIPPYTLKLWFQDGSIKLYDFTPNFKYNVFARLKNPGFFKHAHVSGDSVAWNDDIDIAPEELYENGIPVN